MTSSAAPANGRTADRGSWRGAGALALLAIPATHLIALQDWHARAGYLDAGLLVVCVAAVVAAAAVATRGRRADWLLAAGVAGSAAAGYLISRGIGWPGAGQEVGRWWSLAGSAALLADLLALAVAGAALRRPRPHHPGPVARSARSGGRRTR